MYMNLSDSYRAFAFSASKRVVAHNTHFAISLDHVESANTSDAFCGKLRCNSKGTEYAIYDDSNDPYGLKTGKPRRELGIISYKKKLLGPTSVEVVMPRVRKDGEPPAASVQAGVQADPRAARTHACTPALAHAAATRQQAPEVVARRW